MAHGFFGMGPRPRRDADSPPVEDASREDGFDGASTYPDLCGRRTCSVTEAAQVLGIGRATAYKAAHDGSLPVLRVSTRLLVSVPRLLAMLEGEKQATPRGELEAARSGPCDQRVTS